jgi:uncharacterized Zn finger protein
MPRRITYRCRDCGTERVKDNLTAVRTRLPCTDCGDVTTHERVDA